MLKSFRTKQTKKVYCSVLQIKPVEKLQYVLFSYFTKKNYEHHLLQVLSQTNTVMKTRKNRRFQNFFGVVWEYLPIQEKNSLVKLTQRSGVTFVKPSKLTNQHLKGKLWRFVQLVFLVRLILKTEKKHSHKVITR